MNIFLAIVYLTFADGSIVAYNDGKWDTAPTLIECQQKVNDAVEEMKIMYKDKKEGIPSTFIKLCSQKQE